MPPKTSKKQRQADFFDICRTCAHGCCTGVRPPLSHRRRQIIRKYLKEHDVVIRRPFEREGYTFPRETENGDCIFLDKTTRKCLIHPVKPETCVAGPITFDIDSETRKIRWFLKMDKICPLAGPLQKNREVYYKHDRSAKREIRRLVRDLDAESLRAILAIEEPDTVKIGEDEVASEVLARLKK